MDVFKFCCLFIAVFCVDGIWCKNRNQPDGDKIVGGSETDIQKFPYQAFLLLYNGSSYFQCGGSIVTKRHVVTAAHCLHNIKKIFVRIGSTNSESGGSQYETTTFESHPQYNSGTTDYDAAIVTIPKDMNLDGTKARTIGLVSEGNDPKDGEMMTVTGWGATSQDGSTSVTLRVVQVPVVGRSRCSELLGNGITTRMICAGVTEGGKDSCQGDSGGPAVTNSDNKLAGIVSFGFGCARKNTPGVYARVGDKSIRAFIKTKTGV